MKHTSEVRASPRSSEESDTRVTKSHAAAPLCLGIAMSSLRLHHRQRALVRRDPRKTRNCWPIGCCGWGHGELNDSLSRPRALWRDDRSVATSGLRQFAIGHELPSCFSDFAYWTKIRMPLGESRRRSKRQTGPWRALRRCWRRAGRCDRGAVCGGERRSVVRCGWSGSNRVARMTSLRTG